MKTFNFILTLIFTILAIHGSAQEFIVKLKSGRVMSLPIHSDSLKINPGSTITNSNQLRDSQNIYWNPPKEKNNLSSKASNNFIRLPNGHTYSGSSEGIKMWDNYADITISTENSNIPEDNVTALALDSNKNLWIGTGSSGVVVGYGDPVKPFRTYAIVTHEQNIYSMYTDSQGCVWITYRSGGIECFRNGISISYYPGK